MAKKKAAAELPPGLAEAVAKLVADATSGGELSAVDAVKQLAGKADAPQAGNRRAWIHQLKKQVETYGADAASWYVSWRDPQGKLRTRSCGPGKIGQRSAEKLADKTHASLVEGTYQAKDRKTWKDFRAEFDRKIAARFDGRSFQAMKDSLDAFERVSNPKLVGAVSTELVDEFATKRRKEKGIRGRRLSPATVNKDLRYIRLAMRVAAEWGLVKQSPRIRFLKATEKLPTYVTMEHFTAIYSACEAAEFPNDLPNVEAADWWRALIVSAYMTGWRISQLLSLRWEDVNLDDGTAITRADAVGNKGKRDERIPLHPLIIQHIRPLKNAFQSHVFTWNKPRRQLWNVFATIQGAAKLPNGKPMPQAGKNGWYGFHDFRRAFATENAAKMDLFELQTLMQHKALATTQKYVNMVNRLERPVQNLSVPTLPTVAPKKQG